MLGTPRAHHHGVGVQVRSTVKKSSKRRQGFYGIAGGCARREAKTASLKTVKGWVDTGVRCCGLQKVSRPQRRSLVFLQGESALFPGRMPHNVASRSSERPLGQI